MSFIYYNSNPERKLVGDCVIRAISKVTNQTWEDTYNHAYDGAYAGAYDASQENEYSERRGRSARTRRYVSRDSEKERMIGKLEDMMDSVSTERERRILQQCVDKLEQQ